MHPLDGSANSGRWREKHWFREWELAHALVDELREPGPIHPFLTAFAAPGGWPPRRHLTLVKSVAPLLLIHARGSTGYGGAYITRTVESAHTFSAREGVTIPPRTYWAEGGQG